MTQHSAWPGPMVHQENVTSELEVGFEAIYFSVYENTFSFLFYSY